MAEISVLSPNRKNRENPFSTLFLMSNPQEKNYDGFSIQLFSKVTNIEEIKAEAMKGTIEVSLLSPKLIAGAKCISFACLSAVTSYHSNALKTRSLYTEILYNLAPHVNIGLALTQFGVKNEETSVIAVTYDKIPKTDSLDSINESHVYLRNFNDVKNFIKGERTAIDDLDKFIDIKAIHKIFKITEAEGRKSSLTESCRSRVAIRDYLRGELLFQGAEAKVYLGEVDGEKAIIKHRFSKKYRHPMVDEQISTERTKNEARNLVKARMAGVRTPCVYAVELQHRHIIMEYIDNSITVRNYIYKYADQMKEASGESNGHTIIPELQNLARKIGDDVSKLHQNNIIHGDLTTSNMLLVEPYDQSDLVMIDFGLSSVDEKAEEKAVDLHVLEKAILSTHPNSKEFVEELLSAYGASGGKGGAVVLKKLDEVRLRGRKRICIG